MFGDHYAPAKQLLALLQSVVGPTHEVSQLGEAPTKGQWEHLAQYSGRPLRLVISHRYVSGSVGRLMGAFVGVPLGERPIEVFVDLSPPGPDAMQLLSGMPSLLPYVGVVGFPEEVVRAALDERTVAEMRAAAAACQLTLLDPRGQLAHYVCQRRDTTGLVARPHADARALRSGARFRFYAGGK